MYTEMVIDDAGLSRATAALDRMIAAGETVEATVFPEIVADFHRMEKRRFEQQGPGWAELSGTTLALRRRKGITHDRILEETGRLKAAMTGESDELRIAYTGDELLISVPHYAYWHQTGPYHISVFGRGSAVLPQRKVWEVREVDALRWSKIVKRGLRINIADAIIDLDNLDAG